MHKMTLYDRIDKNSIVVYSAKVPHKGLFWVLNDIIGYIYPEEVVTMSDPHRIRIVFDPNKKYKRTNNDKEKKYLAKRIKRLVKYFLEDEDLRNAFDVYYKVYDKPKSFSQMKMVHEITLLLISFLRSSDKSDDDVSIKQIKKSVIYK